MTAFRRRRTALPPTARQAKGDAMKDARGLDVTTDDATAVAAADDFAARLLRLDQGVEAILDAAKRWPDTPIVQLYAATFWLYGQTGGALETAAVHLRACDALAMNTRERALHRALALWYGNDNLRAVEAMEAITTEWPSDLLTAKIAEFLYYVLGQQYMGPRFRAHAHLGHHPGLRGRATRRHRLALAHRDGRRAHGCAMAFDRRAYRPARARDVHAVHERALRLCARARRPG